MWAQTPRELLPTRNDNGRVGISPPPKIFLTMSRQCETSEVERSVGRIKPCRIGARPAWGPCSYEHRLRGSA